MKACLPKGCIILVQICRGNALRRVTSRLGMLVSFIVLGGLSVAYDTNIVVLESSLYGFLCFIDCLDIGYYFVEAYF